MSVREVKNGTIQCLHPSCKRWRYLKCFKKLTGAKNNYDDICNSCKAEDIRQAKLFPVSKAIKRRMVGERLNKELNK